MIGLEALEDMTRLIPYTAFLDDETPMSVLYIAPPEHGKSELIKKIGGNPRMYQVTDITKWGTEDKITPKIRGKSVRIILIPDLCEPLQRRNWPQLVTYFNSLTSEGHGKTHTFATKDTEQHEGLVHAGLVTSITPAEFWRKKRYELRSTGFINRMLKATYIYTEDMKKTVRAATKGGDYIDYGPIICNLPSDDVHVTLDPGLLDGLYDMIETIATEYNEVGARLTKNLRKLVKASAIDKGRLIVTNEDIERIKTYDPFLRKHVYLVKPP